MRFTCYALGLGWGHLTQPPPGRLLFVNRPMVFCLITAALFTRPLAAQTGKKLSVNDQRARDIFEQLININTTGSSGSTTVAAQAMADRLTQGGFPPADVQVIGPANSIGRSRGAVLKVRPSPIAA